jgi:anti-sigma regulatory factor (Ser/Thr protein kinase)
MPSTAEPFRHEALLYDGPGSFLAGTVPFVREGLDGGEAVMVVLGPDKLELLRDVLGADADAVRFADMAELGRNPARILPAWHDFLAAHGAGGRPVRGIGEPISATRSDDELVECQLHEALLNRAFADTRGFRLRCPYDVALDDVVLQEARCSHPIVDEGAGPSASAEFRGPDAVPAACGSPLPPPPSRADAMSFDVHALADVRRLVARHADAAGLEDLRAGDLVLAVHELATRSIDHGGGFGVLRVWQEGAAVVCEVRDRGQVRDPLAGRRMPGLDDGGGWGLWIANQTCDLVQVRSGPAGTVVRARMAAA